MIQREIEIFYNKTSEKCVSLFFACYATSGHDIIYQKCNETETHNEFEIRKIDLNDIKENEDELI